MESLDPQQLMPMVAFIVAVLFGEHLQVGRTQLRTRRRLAELPIRAR